MDIREVLARNLRIRRQELAHRAGIDRTYISALERCVYAASIDVVGQLAEALGVDPSDLLRKGPPAGRSASTGDAD